MSINSTKTGNLTAVTNSTSVTNQLTKTSSYIGNVSSTLTKQPSNVSVKFQSTNATFITMKTVNISSLATIKSSSLNANVSLTSQITSLDSNLYTQTKIGKID
jgi:hypothetical protein